MIVNNSLRIGRGGQARGLEPKHKSETTEGSLVELSRYGASGTMGSDVSHMIITYFI